MENGASDNNLERAVLLPSDDVEEHTNTEAAWTGAESRCLPPHRVLPIPLIAALAMSSTAATGYYAYATLLCKDAKHCDGEEAAKYAKFVAATVSVSNILGMVALGPLQSISRVHQKLGLLLWLMTRSMSPVMLLLGVRLHNIYVTLSGRIFDGLASDNLLHFTLNAIYTQSPESSTTSSLIGYSLALYMVGISTSPFVAGLFQNLTVSFFIAILLFALAIVYLQLCVTFPRRKSSERNRGPSSNAIDLGDRPYTSLDVASWLIKIFIAPLRAFQNYPASFLCGISLFTYNLVQSYTFSALLVHTSLRFGFTGKENGVIITIAHSIAATYLFTTLYILPRVLVPVPRTSNSQQNTELQSKTNNRLLAVISLSGQSISFLVVGFATKTWHIYVATVLLALGLPTPSFIKSYVVGCFKDQEKNEALAALAAMEVMGDMLGPIVFGGLQSYDAMGGLVFFGAAGMVAISLLLFIFGAVNLGRGSTHASVVFNRAE